MMNERRYDIDWLRVTTIGLLLIYHVAIVFQPWAIFIGFIQSSESLESIWIPMSMINTWRIPILFFVSGMGVAFALKKRNWKQLLGERAKRIFIPFIIGIFVVVPIHYYIFQFYYKHDLSYAAIPSHLWFLGHIFSFVLMLLPIFFWMQKTNEKNPDNWFARLYRSPFILPIIALSFVLESLIVNPGIYEMYASTLHGFVFGFIAFFWGFSAVATGLKLLDTCLKYRWTLFVLSLALFVFRLLVYELKAPNYLMSIESATWIFAILGFTSRYLNKPSKKLKYLSEAAYPIYIWHMAFLYLGAYLILPFEMNVWLKLLLVNAITFLGSFAIYELIIRRVKFIRPLFGLK